MWEFKQGISVQYLLLLNVAEEEVPWRSRYMNSSMYIGTQHLLVNSFHAFELCFDPVPVAFGYSGYALRRLGQRNSRSGSLIDAGLQQVESGPCYKHATDRSIL